MLALFDPAVVISQLLTNLGARFWFFIPIPDVGIKIVWYELEEATAFIVLDLENLVNDLRLRPWGSMMMVCSLESVNKISKALVSRMFAKVLSSSTNDVSIRFVFDIAIREA